MLPKRLLYNHPPSSFTVPLVCARKRETQGGEEGREKGRGGGG